MFEACPRCQMFKTRLEMKWTFSLNSQKDDPDFQMAKEKLGDFDGKKLCFKCYKKLNRKADSIFFAATLMKLINDMAEANMPKEQIVKMGLAFFDGYTRAKRD